MIIDHLDKLLQSILPSTSEPPVWLVDIDDTLTDTRSMHQRAAIAAARDLTQYMPHSVAECVSSRFRVIFEELIRNHQQGPGSDSNELQRSADLEARARGYQKDISAIWGVTRLFSREVLLQIAIEDCNASLTPEELQRCVDRYWQHMFENPILFPDAVRLSQTLASRHAPVYLMTSSDARYRQQPSGQFAYDPEVSRNDKWQRVENLRRYGIEYLQAFIGDPIDKPTTQFFQQAFSTISSDLRRPLGAFPIVVVGDSFRSDIQTPVTLLQSTIGILYRRGQQTVKIESERVFSVGDFNVLIECLDSTEGGERS